MSRRNYQEGKAKRERGAFLAVPAAVLKSRNYARLSPYAVKLLLDLGSQYRGDNNGDLSAAWKLMRPRGWKSEETLHNAKQELLKAGFIQEMRKGQRPNKCSLYALTWLDLDLSAKYDIKPSSFQFGAWKAEEPALALLRPKQISPFTTPTVVGRAA